MQTVDTTANAEATATQSQITNSPAAQADRALQNQGDNVRASWPLSLDSLRANISHCSPEGRDLLVWAFTWCIDSAHPLSMQEFSERVGYAFNTIYKIYTGKYIHPTQKTRMDVPKELLKELRNFRRVEVSRAKLGKNKFVMTPTAKAIFLACDLARESQTPVFIEGASHIGKTEGFRQWVIENNHGKSVLIELEAVNGLQGLVKAICAKLGISPKGNTADLLERMKKAITPDMVLIFDEVHLLAHTYRRESFFACMEFIRRLYDFCKCGIVLSFTKLGFTTAEKERKRELEQIFRRGVHRKNLGDRPLVKDVQMIIEEWNLEFPARKETVQIQVGRETFTETPYEMLAQLSSEQGLKAIIERLRYASKFAADEETDLTWQHVVKAHYIITKAAQAPDHGWNS